jgi:hypothetical protein
LPGDTSPILFAVSTALIGLNYWFSREQVSPFHPPYRRVKHPNLGRCFICLTLGAGLWLNQQSHLWHIPVLDVMLIVLGSLGAVGVLSNYLYFRDAPSAVQQTGFAH